MSKETLSDEEFWTEFKEFLFSENKIESASEEVEKILDLAEISDAGRILDMPCGVGRHSIELQKRGFEIVGVDRTRAYIKEARGKEGSESIEFVRQDMKDFRREESFDAVINWWNSFGYFEKKADDLKMLENMHDSLKENGVLLMDVWSKELTAKGEFRQRWTEEDGIYNMEKGRVKENWKKVERTWIKVEDGETVEYTWEQRLYSASELEEALEDSGFSEVSFYGNVDGDDYDEDAERMIVVARK